MMSLISAVVAKIKENKAEYTIAILAALLALLFGVIWYGWLYGILARTGAVVPRSVLGAIIGVLLIAQAASVAFILHYYREAERLASLANLPSEIKTLQNQNDELEKKISQVSENKWDMTPSFRQALARLSSLNENLPTGQIQEKFVSDYHQIVKELQWETGEDLSGFLVPETEVRARVLGSRTRRIGSFPSEQNQQPRYSQHRYCDREVFMMRLHGLIKFLRDIGLDF